MEIIADKITFGGKSLGKLTTTSNTDNSSGKNIFIPYAIPGETYEIELTDSKRDYDEGKITKIIKSSPHRVTPPCPYYGKCGGCNMMHIDCDYQRTLRKDILFDIFNQNKIDLTEKINIVHGPDFNYRARFQLNNGGLSEKNSNNIVPITECLCAEKPINDYLSNVSFEQRTKGRIHLFGSDYVIHNGQGNSKLAISFENDKDKNAKKIIGKGSTKNLKT